MSTSAFPDAGRRSLRAVRPILVAAGILAAAGASADADRALRTFKAGKWVEASAMYQALVDESPGFAYGYYMLGNCFLKMEDARQAERSFRQAIERNGERFEYHHGLSHALMAQGSYEEAVETLSSAEALVQQPQQRFAFHALRGTNYAALKQWAPAARDLEVAASMRQDKMVLDQLGRAEAALGRYGRAVAVLRLSTSRDPSDLEVKRLLAESLLRIAPAAPDPFTKRSTYVEALRAAEAVVAGNPTGVSAVDLLGRAALGAGDYTRASSAFRAVLDTEPGNCLARLNLASAQIAARALQEAETTLHEAKRCPQVAAAAYLRLGHIHLLRGRPGEALAAYTRSDSIEPTPAARSGIAAARALVLPSAPTGTAPVRH
jgi:tetratricopeptide (TPR) repeat protein